MESVNIIKETLHFEVDEKEGLPEGYAQCLEQIRKMILHVKTQDESESLTCNDLSLEFGNDTFDEEPIERPSTEHFFEQLREQESLFKIVLKLDTDIYLRGFDHFCFLKIYRMWGADFSFLLE